MGVKGNTTLLTRLWKDQKSSKNTHSRPGSLCLEPFSCDPIEHKTRVKTPPNVQFLNPHFAQLLDPYAALAGGGSNAMDVVATNSTEKIRGFASVCFTTPLRLYPSQPRDSIGLLAASRFAREGLLEAFAVMEAEDPVGDIYGSVDLKTLSGLANIKSPSFKKRAAVLLKELKA
ncbi:hypothetical protein E2562_007063 [Oryza meyeriana var. granulata]|uniref:Uncharacterized protein n=1 Tax=Oryza meyeriana var. granulata TaxID=110450 RepID=A0A6G1F4M4_9ORYZ|nr:hypothetical protein E2562_007063 [Oryza meyeriana var. granulata]